MSGETVRMLLDTDIGSDVDDAMALCFALRSPEIALEGVTTVYGDVGLRARIAMKLIALSGAGAIPVRAGIARPLLRERPVHWMGHEGEGILTDDDRGMPVSDGHAVDFIVGKVRENKGRLTLAAIGPLTNIAAAIIVAPEIVDEVKELIFIGGVARFGDNSLEVPALEWNVKCDPEAARVVFTSGIPLTMLGMDVTRRAETRMDQSHLERMKRAGTPLSDAAAHLVEIYWRHAEPKMRCIHDVLAVAYAFDRDLVRTERLKVEIETEGSCTSGLTLVTRDAERANADVGLEVRDRFLELFMSRLCGSLR